MAVKLSPLDGLAPAALICYGGTVLPFVSHAVAIASGATLCFLLTAVALANAILPCRINAIARFTGVVACALAAGMVGGLLLNILPTGLSRSSWAAYGLATTLIAYTVARARRADQQLTWSRPDIRMPPWDSWVKILIAGALVVATVAVSATSRNHEPTFTEVWLVPDGADRSPVRASSAVLGIKSHESSNEVFVVVTDTGTRTTKITVPLAPEEVWTHNVAVEGTQAVASVFRGSLSDHPYRTVWVVTH